MFMSKHKHAFTWGPHALARHHGKHRNPFRRRRECSQPHHLGDILPAGAKPLEVGVSHAQDAQLGPDFRGPQPALIGPDKG